MNSILTVKVLTREKTLFQGVAFAVTSINEKGTFDILPGHENFISQIYKTLIIHEENGRDTNIPIDQGVLKVYQNIIEVYLVTSIKGVSSVPNVSKASRV